MADEDNKFSERPPDSDFQQQNLKAWQPLLTPAWVIGTFAVIGVLFFVIGVIVLVASNSVVQIEVQYDNIEPVDPSCTRNCKKIVELPITDTMGGPDSKIFFYYKLTHFYQNHRRYVKSRNDAQLRGEAGGSLGSCAPLEQWDVVVEGETVQKTLYPCGLIANSYFNDTFENQTQLYDPANETDAGTPVAWTETGIAWESDVKDKYKELEFDPATMTRYGPGGFELPHVTKEDFIVWMRTAGLPTFKKLRYIMHGVTLQKGSTFRVEVTDSFPVKDFEGTKSIVISTASWLGGQNYFLAYAYITVASLCLFLALVFLIKHLVSPRKLGDMKYFNFDSGKNRPK